MKRILIIIPLFIVLLLAGAISAFNSGLFHDYVQREVQAAMGPGSNVRLGNMKLLYRWPPLLEIGPSTIERLQASMQWQVLSAEFLKVTPPYSLSLNLTQPYVVVKSPPATGAVAITPQAKSSAAPGVVTAGAPIPISLRLHIASGEIKTDFANITGLNLQFEQKLLMRTPASLHVGGSLRLKALPVGLPFRVDTDTLIFSEQMVKTTALQLVLGGLISNVQGTSLLTEGRHRWVMDISAKDLAQLPQPPMDIPAKNWRGEVQLKAEIVKSAADQPWSADGSFLAKEVSADVNFKQEKAAVQGPFLLDAEGKFSYHNSRLSLPNLKATLDLTSAKVTYQDMLSKLPARAMKISILAGGDQHKLNIQELLFQLADFSGKVLGSVELQSPWPGQLHFTLKPTNLTGTERWFLPLRASPVQGELSMEAKIDGPLAEPMKARIKLESLGLKKFSGVVHFEREGLLKLRGPVMVDIQGKGEWADGQVKAAEGKGAVDLSAAAVVAGPLRKEEGAIFKARYALRTQGQAILIDEMELTSFTGNLGLNGKVERSATPTVNLNLHAKPLSLSELRIAMPGFREKIPRGTLNGNLHVTGKLEMDKAWHDWPLQVSGSVDVKIPEYTIQSPPPPVKGVGSVVPAPPAAEPVATAFLPDGVLTRKARLALKARVDQFKKDALIAHAITSEGTLANGVFTGQVTVGQVFGGSVQVKNLNVPMLQENPKVQGSASWLNLVIEEALGFVNPEYRTMVTGKTAGLVDFATLMPGHAQFMNELKVRGDVVAQPVTFNTVKVGEMINEQIAKVPMLKLKPAKVEPLRGKATAQFNLNAGIVDIPSFQGVAVDNSEIQMKGKVVLASMEGDFAGTFFWNDPPVKGCALEGNADSKGRMVVPLAIKGNLMKPGISLLSDVLGKLAGKAAECEGKKLVEKIKVDGTKQLEKEMKKKLKGLFGK